MDHVVLITNQVPESVTEPVKGLAEVRMGGTGFDTMSRTEVLDSATDCSAIINQAELRVDEELLEVLPNLKVVANVANGTDNLDLEAMEHHGVWATNVLGVFGQAAAEYVMAGMLAVSRRLFEVDAFVRSGEWHLFQPGRWDSPGLFGKTLGIIGYGRIGRTLATYASAMGMTVIPYDRGYGNEVLERVLTESDYISLHVPLTPDTYGLIGGTEIGRMKPGAVLINASRGVVVDEQAMITALQSGQLGGAVLDVFADEPVVPEELRRMPQVLLSPHVAGGTHRTREEGRLSAFRNVASVLRGDTPPNALNRPTELKR
jgi:glyoxylate reductase